MFDELLQPRHIGKGKDGNGMQHTRLEVLSVSRNENALLYERYARCANRAAATPGRHTLSVLTASLRDAVARQWVSSLGLKSDCNEVLLMHGAPRKGAVRWRWKQSSGAWEPGERIEFDPVRAILKYGFDPRVARSGMLGQGTYCAERPCKADRYALRYSDLQVSSSAGEEAQLFLCRAMLGRSFKTSTAIPGLRRPPCLAGHHGPCHHERFNSVVFEGSKKYREFVLYDGSQIFPEFLVRYRRLAEPCP